MGTVSIKLFRMKLLFILLVATLAFAEDDDYPYTDENCEDRCCTLRITRPVDENAENYSGVYKKKGSRHNVNGSPKYVKKGSNGTIWMQVNIGYDADYEDFPNWGIMDDNMNQYYPIIEGGIQGPSPAGDWPNGGAATCIKYNKKGTVCRKIRYDHEPGMNGIYDKQTNVYDADMGYQQWKQRDNFYWVFKFNKEHEENKDPEAYNDPEGGFIRYPLGICFDDVSDDKSGGKLEGTW